MKRFSVFFLVVLMLINFAALSFSQTIQTTPLAKLYYELKALLEKPDANLSDAINQILQKYAPIVEPILPPGEYEEYSLSMSQLDKELKEMGIWITRATVEIFNQEIVEGPFELNYDRETGQATGLIQN